MAAEPSPEIPFVSAHESEGVILIYGRDERAIEAADLLKDHLDITVLIRPPAAVLPPRVTEYPVVKGLIRAAKGHLGAFELTVDDFAQPAPSSRARAQLRSEQERRGVALRHRARPVRRRAAVRGLRSARRLSARRSRRSEPQCCARCCKARDLVGTFDKPRYVNFTADLCAHSRSQRRRLHPLPRSLPDRRDHARRRPRRDRRAYVRRAAGNARRSARLAPRPTRCRRPTR